MEFILKNSFNIDIAKFNKKDLKITPKGILILGKDKQAGKLRLQPLYTKKFIEAVQIAEYYDYVYVPKDKLPEDDYIYTFTKPLIIRTLPKYKWLEIKQSHPYKGNI